MDRPLPDWRGAPFLYLFTHAFDYASPVCWTDGKPVPVFSLPVSFPVKDHLYCWQGRYRHLDNIWLECSTLELPAYHELADPSSELSQTGRELCREIESATGVPVYYYLMRYHRRRRREEWRPCPGCGAAWSTGDPAETPRLFWHFEFKCDACRLVSHCGSRD